MCTDEEEEAAEAICYANLLAAAAAQSHKS
jgi:hypothetical protein